MEYAYRPGARFQKGASVPAQVVGERLEELRQENGGALTPELVVEDGRNPNSPFFPFLQWDDQSAAAEWRLNQARSLIRAVVVRYRRSADDVPRTVRAFVSVQQDEDRGYVAVAQVMSDERLRAQAIRKAWDELAAFRKRYAEISEFAVLFAAVDELERSLPPIMEAA